MAIETIKRTDEPKIEKEPKRKECKPNDHVGPIQDWTECCLNCGKNIWDD